MRAKAFTLVELLVAISLTAIGIVAMVGALSGMTRAQSALEDQERVYRLAEEKYDELVATGAWEIESEGEFDGANAGEYSWSLEVVDTGVESLSGLRLTVSPVSGNRRSAVIEGLVLTPPQTTEPGGVQP